MNGCFRWGGGNSALGWRLNGINIDPAYQELHFTYQCAGEIEAKSDKVSDFHMLSPMKEVFYGSMLPCYSENTKGSYNTSTL